jgi:carboxyl-terminal processing protease
VEEVTLASLRGRMPREVGERQARMRATALAAARFGGDAGTPVGADFVDGAGRAVSLSLVRTPERGAPVRFGNLPPFYTSFERERLTAPGGASVGVLRFNVWMASIVRPFDDAVDALRDADGMVIDLRGNPGGVGALVMGTSGHFLTTRDTLGTMRTRSSDMRFVANPRVVSRSGARVRPFAGPLVVLVDAHSASTSEIFAGGLQAIGRARVVGDTTAGMALPALMERLPNRDVLYHAFADFFTPRGERLEGRGVVPDEVVPLTRDALLAGRDPQMDAALRWIAGQVRK